MYENNYCQCARITDDGGTETNKILTQLTYFAVPQTIIVDNTRITRMIQFNVKRKRRFGKC